MPLLNREIKQLCPKCKGTGINDKKVKKDDLGRVVLAPIYEKGEGNKPQYENCEICDGEGRTLQPLPTEVMRDGTKVKLSKRDAFMRVNPDIVLPEEAFREERV